MPAIIRPSLLTLAGLLGIALAAEPVEYAFLKDRVQKWGLERQIGGYGFDPVTSPVHTGAVSLRLGAGSTVTRGDVKMEHGTNLPTHIFSHLRLWIHGGEAGGQQPKLAAIVRDPFTRAPTTLSAIGLAAHLVAADGSAAPAIPAGAWIEARIPLAALGVAAAGNFAGLLIPAPQSHATFYLADIALVGPPASPTAAARVDLARLREQPVPTVFSGVNIGYWDMYANYLPTAEGAAQLREAGLRFLRYHPANPELNWSTSAWDLTVPLNALEPGGYVRYLNLVEAIGGDGVMSLNYMLGSPQQAAAVVAYTNVAEDAPAELLDLPLGEADEVTVIELPTEANGRKGRYEKIRRDWKTVGYWVRLRAETPVAGNPDRLNHLRAGHPKPWRITYWELGNELWMLGEGPDLDTRAVLGARTGSPQDISAFGMAMREAVRRVDPRAKLGIHIELTWSDSPSEIAYRIPGSDHETSEHREALFAAMAGVDPVTGLRDPQRARWMPDFLISHNYVGSSRHDLHVLQLANNRDFLNWRIRERIIRQRLARWYGDDPALAAIELHDNENGLPPSNPDNQQVNLVAGLVCADSLGIALQSGFTNLCWFGLSGGGGSKAVNPNAAGWRTFGGYAMMVAKKEGSGVGACAGDFHGAKLPTFYAHKLLQHLAVAGDRVVDGDAIVSDHPYVAVYAARRADGSASLLVINKSADAAITTTIALSGLGFTPTPSAEMLCYGTAEDEAQRVRWESRDYTNVDLTTSTLDGVAADGLTITLPPASMSVVRLRPAR